MTAPKSVLIYSMGEVIGDGLVKLPFIASLKDAFPNASIHWCAAKGSTVYSTSLKPIVAGFIDEVIDNGVTGAKVYDLLLLKQPFGGRRFDVVIDTQTNVRRSMVVKRARAQGGVFVSPAADFRFSDRKLSVPWTEAMVDRLQTLASMAAGRPVAARPVVLTDARALEAATAILPSGSAYVGFAPGSGGVSKRWPLERFIGLAKGQADQRRTPVFFLGPGEAEMADIVRVAIPNALFPETNRVDVFQDIEGPLLVVALASRLLAAVANDAGPGHMLAAGGAPLLSLQGIRRKAVKFHPAAARLTMLIAEDFGASPGGEALDMAAIPLEEAARALDALIAGGR
jgi:ADP-heptose:LPS heptosyltransferase